MRIELQTLTRHAVDELRQRGRDVASEIEAIEEAIKSIETVVSEDTRHLNEIITLSMKVHRSTAARAVLNGVEFEACPRCAQALPQRSKNLCHLCGQPDLNPANQQDESDKIDKDVVERSRELKESIRQHEAQLRNLNHRLGGLEESKSHIDTELNTAVQQYDSAFLSQALTLEHRRATLEQEIIQLNKLRVLPQKVEELKSRADLLAADESRLRGELKEAREAAEKDTANLKKLQNLFLDCLVRAKVPGFTTEDQVVLKSPNFLPEVFGPGGEDSTVTSFSNLGSGGKKTLFKCCFALAIHRLAVETNVLLPRLLIIDSPMKNISERENRQQFEGFHELLYELAANELISVQFILIDKEFLRPYGNININLLQRHMTLDNPKEPPLVSYYTGH